MGWRENYHHHLQLHSWVLLSHGLQTHSKVQFLLQNRHSLNFDYAFTVLIYEYFGSYRMLVCEIKPVRNDLLAAPLKHGLLILLEDQSAPQNKYLKRWPLCPNSLRLFHCSAVWLLILAWKIDY
jgi:hypothetical protein